MPSPDDQCCVYYISDANCTDPYRHGYVGLTSNEVTRRYNHRRSGRPERGIGWNSDLGGGRWRNPKFKE